MKTKLAKRIGLTNMVRNRVLVFILTGVFTVIINFSFFIQLDGAECAMLKEEIKSKDKQELFQDKINNNIPKKPRYASGEIIVKFDPETSSVIKENILKSKDFSISGKKIQDIDSLPDKVRGKKSFIKDDTECTPLFKGLYKRMQKEKKTEAQLKKEIVSKLSKKRKVKKKEKKDNLSNIYVFKNVGTNGKSVEEIAKELSQVSGIEYAEPNYLFELNMVPNDTFYSSSSTWGQPYDDLWGLKQDKLNCGPAWDIVQGEGVIVAVVDGGIDYTHPDISANVWINQGETLGNGIDDDGNGFIDDYYGYDFHYNDNDPRDYFGHGTHVAGTIAAVGNNDIGIIGVAPKSNVMAVKGFADRKGYGYATNLANCLHYAANMGADVINNSWGGYGPSKVLEDAVNYAYSLGCILVASAGNTYSIRINHIPSRYPNVIAVSAFDQNDERCYFSNYGFDTELSAPGGNGAGNVYNILSLLASGSVLSREYDYYKYIINSQYIRLAGTSMSSPHVAGLAALVLSKNANLTNEQVRQVLRLSADDVGPQGFDIYSGYGRINAYKALQIDNVCTVKITSPSNYQFFGDQVEIKGTIEGIFDEWRIYYYSEKDPSQEILISSGTGSSVEYIWDIKDVSNSICYLKLLTVKEGEIRGIDVVEIGIDHRMLEGWPQFRGGGINTDSICADVDNDGDMEILTACVDSWNGNRGVFLFSHDGSLMNYWDLLVDATPALADLDGDGDLEIIMVGIDYSENKMFVIRAYHHTGELLWENVYTDVGGSSYHSPVVSDINNDGYLEIIIGTYSKTAIIVFDHEGNIVSPFPYSFGDSQSGYCPSEMAVGDLDGDGQKEIVCVTLNYGFMVLNNKAEIVWKKKCYELEASNNFRSLALGDLDLDGKLEIIIAFNKPRANKVYVFNSNGEIRSGWPKTITTHVSNSPMLGDIDRDGDLEVVVGAYGRIYAWHDDGQLIFQQETPGNLPYPKKFLYASCIGDFTGDENMEIIGASYDGNLYAWTSIGEPLPGWPLSTRGTLRPAAIGDLDQDGYLDIVVSSNDGYVYTWRIGEKSYEEGQLEWPMKNHDPQHTHCYVPDVYEISAYIHYSVSEGGTFNFQGGALFTPDYGTRSIVSYEWDFGDGTTSTKQNPTHRYTNNASYKVTLKVTDNLGKSDTTEVTIETTDAYAITTNINHTVKEGGRVAFQGSTVFTTDYGTRYIVSYNWDFGDGAKSTEQNPTHRYTKNGTYTVSLKTTDDLGNYDIAKVAIEITDGYVLTASTYINHMEGGAVSSQGSGDFSPDYGTRTIVSYLWDFGDGIISSGQNPVYRYTTNGTYIVSLKVTDDLGNSDITKVAIHITDAYKLTANINYIIEDDTVAFQGSAIFSPDYGKRYIVSYFWDLGDGTTSTLQNPIHHYLDSCNYNVSLTVTDDLGNSDINIAIVYRAPIWYLAEGCTSGSFDTWILIMNPNSQSAPVRITFMKPDGSTVTDEMTVPPTSRHTIYVNRYIPNDSVSTMVESQNNIPIIVERSMYWNSGGLHWGGGHNSTGVTSLATEWYLAEGCTLGSFDEWVLIMNPNNQSANITATFMLPDGRTIIKYITVRPTSRHTIYVNDTVPNDSVSVKINSDIPIAVERAMYWDSGNYRWVEGHVATGVTTPFTEWYLAEGCTDGFSEWVLIMNPNAQPTPVTVTFMKPDGSTVVKEVTLPATSRYTIHVNDYVPNTSLSTHIRADLPVIAERAMYWDSGNLHWAGGHVSQGSTTTGTKWYLAEGYTGSSFSTWLLIMNPNGTDASVKVTFMKPDGTMVEKYLTVKATSRYTIYVNNYVPGDSVSIRVESINGVSVIAERAMYWDSGDYHWKAGHASIGVK